MNKDPLTYQAFAVLGYGATHKYNSLDLVWIFRKFCQIVSWRPPKDPRPVILRILLMHLLATFITWLIFGRWLKQGVATLCFDQNFMSKHRVGTLCFDCLSKISPVVSKTVNMWSRIFRNMSSVEQNIGLLSFVLVILQKISPVVKVMRKIKSWT